MGILKFAITLLSCVQLYAQSIEPTTLFLGTIKFPSEIETKNLCLYYKGQKLQCDWDKNNLSAQFSFLESKSSQTLYLLICNIPSYQTHSTNNTIQHLLTTDENYRCYQLQATRIYDDLDNLISYSWDCIECTFQDGIIPDNTVIFLFNPALIDGIQIHAWNKNQTMRLIPTIKIVSTATAQELVRATTIARLTAIEIDTIHSKEPAKNNPARTKVKLA